MPAASGRWPKVSQVLGGEQHPLSTFARAPSSSELPSFAFFVANDDDAPRAKLTSVFTPWLLAQPVDCVRQVVQADGVGGLYRGVASPLVGQMFFNACLIGTYDAVKRAMLRSSGQDELSNLELLGAGSITGAIAASIETPVDLFKSKMQLQTLHLEAALAQGKHVKPEFTTTWGCVQLVSREWGLRGWYQGLHSTVLRNSVANGCFFSIYEIVKRYLVRRQNGARAGPGVLLTAGATGGFLCVAVSHPLDVVKSAIMSDNLANRRYHGVLDCAQKIYRQQGMGGFSKGLVPGLMRASIGNATLVLTVEMVRGYLNS
jgi:solute carrier family 25 carnitine/acylcarnitine transporter 20/29